MSYGRFCCQKTCYIVKFEQQQKRALQCKSISITHDVMPISNNQQL